MPVIEGLQAIRARNGLAHELGRAPLMDAVPGLFVAASGNGDTLGPVVGRPTAEAVLGRGAGGAVRLGRIKARAGQLSLW